MANYYCCTLGDVMSAALPAALKLSSETRFVPVNDDDESELSEKEQAVVRAIRVRGSMTLDDIADLQLEGCNVDNLSVDHDVAVADHLSSLEDRLCVSESPDCSCKSELKEAKEVKRGVAAHSLRFLKRVRELLLKHVVVAADDLLRQKLLAVFGLPSILEVWTMLTERVWALGYRAVWSTPNVVADSAADVCLSSSISCHF
jgi:CBS domain-containing protein